MTFTATLTFLKSIGISSEIEESASGFLPGILISKGALMVAPGCHPADILHEAGHLAIIPTRYRSRFSVDIDNEAIWKPIFDEIAELRLHPDHPLSRALIQCSDAEATAWAWAWAWAAGHAIGLAPTDVIRDDSYPDHNGRPGGEEMRFRLIHNSWLGIHGLHHAGMCELPRRTDGFPRLKKWLQDADVGTVDERFMHY